MEQGGLAEENPNNELKQYKSAGVLGQIVIWEY